MIFRQNKNQLERVFESESQTYSFNFPKQCGTNCDLPFEAKDNEHEVLQNDIVVLASDGVLDNLFEKQIAACIKLNI